LLTKDLGSSINKNDIKRFVKRIIKNFEPYWQKTRFSKKKINTPNFAP
jgi:hypothetical protein